jgi:hypothetical protein
MIRQFLAGAAAVATTAVEVYCVYDGLKAKGGAMLVAGVGIATLGPLIGLFSQGRQRKMGAIAFVFALACIIVASGSRVGGAIDRAEGQREQAARATKIAKDTERELHELLADARAVAKKACAEGREKTKACHDANAKVDELVTKWTNAGTKLATTPNAAGEGDIARVAAWLGGYVTPHQVSLYLPLLWPITMALMGVFFWGACAPAFPQPVPAPGAAPQPAEPVITDTDVLDVLIDMVRPAGARNRVEIEDIHLRYVESCKARGVAVAPDEVFSAQAKAFAQVAKIRTLASAGKLYWCGVTLVA